VTFLEAKEFVSGCRGFRKTPEPNWLEDMVMRAYDKGRAEEEIKAYNRGYDKGYEAGLNSYEESYNVGYEHGHAAATEAIEAYAGLNLA